MKKYTTASVLAAMFLSISTASADKFGGAYVGGKVGANTTDMTAVSRQTPASSGLEGGYNWHLTSILVGIDGFMDFNAGKSHAGSAPAPATVNYGSRVYGLDFKLGLPDKVWMPYAKLGYAHIGGTGDAYASVVGNSGTHLGLGVEYKFAPDWSVAGEWTNSTGKNGSTTLNNDNFTIGVNYYFGKPRVAPVAAPAVAAPVVAAPVAVAPPAIAPEVAPKVQAEPVQNETWNTLLENKPVCIEGANFKFDSAKLRDGEIRKLNDIVSFSEKYKDAILESSGHTDSIGTAAYNQKLSERRAASVKEYLVKRGVAGQRIMTVGYGESRPIADNKTPEGREQNRRVEVCTVLKVERKVRLTE